MATIKDIAKLAGVSQGTVSNVLTNKDNVSSEKIKRVLDAAKKLDYVPNYSAKNLRKGHTNQLHLILPNIRSKTYNDIYQSFNMLARMYGFEINLMISNDNPDLETHFINSLQAELDSNMAVAVVTTIPFGDRYQSFNVKSLENIIFLIKDYIDSKHHITHDFESAGETLIKKTISDGYNNICVLSNSVISSNEISFEKGIRRSGLQVDTIFVDPLLQNQSIMESITHHDYDAYLVADFDFAQTLKQLLFNFMPDSNTPIYVVSPLFVLQETNFIKYELDYRLFGHTVAEMMIEQKLVGKPTILSSLGIRNWEPSIIDSNKLNDTPLRILTVNNPSASVLEKLIVQYNKLTGVKIEIDIKEYDEVYEVLSNLDALKNYDIVRNDINWMKWNGTDIYTPLDTAYPTFKRIKDEIINGILDENLIYDNKLYALPFSPSTQVLFYRKDLFERIDIRRKFKEIHGFELEPPKDFDTYNIIAKFFTKAFNPESPTTYGATLTLGNTGVAGSEFLSRYFAQTDKLYDENNGNKINFKSPLVSKTIAQIRELKKYSNLDYNKWWTDTANTFAEGDTAMAIMYSNYSSDMMSFDSNVIGKIGSAPVPGNNPLMGGGAVGITKHSKYQELAVNFIKWLTSETISSSSTLLGNLPSHKKTYTYYEILELYPWFQISLDGIQNSRCLRISPDSNQRFNERELLNIIGSMTIDAYNHDELEIETIQDALQQKYEDNLDVIYPDI